MGSLNNPGQLPSRIRKMVKAALQEDLGLSGDVTTRSFLPHRTALRTTIRARQAGIVCGTALAAYVFSKIGARTTIRVPDGRSVRAGQTVLEVRGGPAILSAERVALNFLQRLSGISTLTRAFVRRAGRVVFDTRKTTPLWRELEKYAVRCGGGRNHRHGLYDAALFKDNHWAALGYGAAPQAPRASGASRVPALRAGAPQGSRALRATGHRLLEERFRKGVRRFRKRHPRLELEVEIENERQLDLALSCGVDAILLDNMGVPALARVIRRIRSRRPPPLDTRLGRFDRPRAPRGGRGFMVPGALRRGRPPIVEISGGVNLLTAARVARLKPDRISVGRLTHSAPAMDFSLEVIERQQRKVSKRH